MVREHHAPVGALRRREDRRYNENREVREHHAPVGALRPSGEEVGNNVNFGQGAPRTCRCIETSLYRLNIA